MNTTLGLPRHSPQLCFWWMIDRSLWRILILTRTGDYKPLPLPWTKSLLTPLPDLFHFLSQLVPILCRAGGGATHRGEVVIICMDCFMVTHFSDFKSYNELLLCRYVEESKIFLPVKQGRYMATTIAATPSHYYLSISISRISSAGALRLRWQTERQRVPWFATSAEVHCNILVLCSNLHYSLSKSKN